MPVGVKGGGKRMRVVHPDLYREASRVMQLWACGVSGRNVPQLRYAVGRLSGDELAIRADADAFDPRRVPPDRTRRIRHPLPVVPLEVSQVDAVGLRGVLGFEQIVNRAE